MSHVLDLWSGAQISRGNTYHCNTGTDIHVQCWPTSCLDCNMQGRRVTNDFSSVGLLRMPPQLVAPRRCVHLCLSCGLQRSYIGEPQFLHERLLRFIMFLLPWWLGWRVGRRLLVSTLWSWGVSFGNKLAKYCTIIIPQLSRGDSTLA